jgi:proteic killer suppression protein
MIRSFADRDTERFFTKGVCPPKWRTFATVARRKLDMVDYATRLLDLASPPGNRLEALKGDRKGQHSIRINDQWRVCLPWTRDGPEHVEIADYHR